MRHPARFLSTPLLVFAALASGCAGPSAVSRESEAASVTVIGVTRREGVASSLNRGAAALDLVARLRGGERRRVVAGPERARAALGDEPLTALLRRFAADGQLGGGDLSRLARAPLGTSLALVVRIEGDETSELAPRALPVRDAAGRVLADRFLELRAARRETTLSAELVDLGAGGPLWRRAYTTAPLVRREDVRYRGSSFGGSVAALLANTVVNGPARPDGPAPPSLRATLLTLFDELEGALP